MKKLMFAAALAATGMTYAAAPAGQVYDVTLSIKTTAAASATINNKTNPFLGEEKELVVYRKQANQSWKGLIWGCSCEAIDGVWEEVNEVAESGYSTIKGCIIWDTKTKKPVFIGNGADLTDEWTAQDKGFGWIFLNAIDKNGKKVEGTWQMSQSGEACEETDELFDFSGAGFGTLNVASAEDCGGNYLKSISGNFAGWMKAPYATVSTDWSGCTFCGYEPGVTECEYSTVWDYCSCLGITDESKTAAYGTWKVCYNSGLSNKLSKPVKISNKGIDNLVVSIRDAYNFNSLPYVAAAIAAIENTFWGLTTKCEDLEAAVTKAQGELDAVSDATLWAAVQTAEANWTTATNAQATAKYQYEVASDVATTANGAYETALYNETNCTWTIKYVNASQQTTTVTGTGCAKLTLAAEEFKYFTLTECTIDLPTATVSEVYTTWKQVTDRVAALTKATVDSKNALETAKTNKQNAKEALDDAKDDVDAAAQDLSKANNAWLNRTSLQYYAQQKLERAEAAYENAGCGVID